MATHEQVLAWEAQDAADVARFTAEAERMTEDEIASDLEEGDGTPYLRDKTLRAVLRRKREEAVATAQAAEVAEYERVRALLPPGTVIAVPPSGLIGDRGWVVEVVAVGYLPPGGRCADVGVTVRVDGAKRTEEHNLAALASHVAKGRVRTDLPPRAVRDRLHALTATRHVVDGKTWWVGLERDPGKYVPDHIVVDERGRKCMRVALIADLLKRGSRP